MHKQYEDEAWRIKNADDATITFTIALHGPHAWEVKLEDRRRYHSINMGGPLMIRTIGKMPSRPCCVDFSSRINVWATILNR